MIRKHQLNIEQYINNWLPSHMRKANRLGLFGVLFTPFTIMMEEFLVWRNKAVTRANVTSETISIEWYLNYLFDPTDKRIHIESNDGDGVILGIKGAEPTKFIYLGLKGTEALKFEFFYFPGEVNDLGTATFAVYIPAALTSSADAIGAEVKKYKLAGKTFIIIPE